MIETLKLLDTYFNICIQIQINNCCYVVVEA